MAMNRRALLGTGAAAAAVAALPRLSRAQAANTYRIGVLTDMSGTYRDNTGPTSAACVRQAVAEFANRGFNVEVIDADHQNRPDLGVSLARQWYDQGIDMLLDVPTSSVGLAVQQVAREKGKAVLQVGSATADLTGPACSPNAVHWAYDTYMLAKSTGAAMVKAGGDSWFFITADYAFGHALERDTSAQVKASGGRVLGAVRTPFPGTTDFSSFLVQAMATRPKIIGLANAGLDTINCVKQAAEFGVTRRGVKLACMLMFITDVHSIGLEQGAGLVMTESFYWDMNDRTRAFLNRVKPRLTNVYPNCIHAGNYSATLHALKAIGDMGVAAAKASGAEVISRMKAMPTDDDAFGPGLIRADGRKIHPSFLFEVKAKAESRGPWDYLKLLQTTPAEEAFRPIADGNCPLVRS
jgi:branched-chain amino acid transport system substrate-binding protein